jgi:hypothetical protein
MLVALLLDVEAASRVRYGNYTSRYLHVIHLLIAVLQAFAVQEGCHRNKQCPCTKQTARESTEYIFFSYSCTYILVLGLNWHELRMQSKS